MFEADRFYIIKSGDLIETYPWRTAVVTGEMNVQYEIMNMNHMAEVERHCHLNIFVGIDMADMDSGYAVRKSTPLMMKIKKVGLPVPLSRLYGCNKSEQFIFV